MQNLELYFTLLVVVQILHSIEEMLTHFEERWLLWKMSRGVFMSFEIVFTLFLLATVFMKQIPARETIMQSFNVLMFANGIWHLMWAGIEKKYVPGLITAPIFIIIFLMFYFQLFT